jgi:hypothetical protein
MEDMRLHFMKMYLLMGDMTEQTLEEKIAYRERIIFATEGIVKPTNWDELDIKEKEERIEQLYEELFG